MKKLEIFKNEKIVVNVRSQKQYDDFMKMCEKQGLKWGSGSFPTQESYYKNYKENTCINLNNLKCLYYCDINSYKNDGYKIITYEDFIKEESIQFTKSDLKNNHIIKARNGNKYIWFNYQMKNRLREDLRDSYWDNDIIEVYEFETLVWKREEKPVEILDEIEIIEEAKQIEKIEINYARDIEEKIFYEESDKPNHCILGDAGTELLINKINELIDEVNKLKKKEMIKYD